MNDQRVRELSDGEEMVVEERGGQGFLRRSQGSDDRGPKAGFRSGVRIGGTSALTTTHSSLHERKRSAPVSPPKTEGLIPLDRDRAASVADEGGVSAAKVEL